jgi:hypothetical protein
MTPVSIRERLRAATQSQISIDNLQLDTQYLGVRQMLILAVEHHLNLGLVRPLQGKSFTEESSCPQRKRQLKRKRNTNRPRDVTSLLKQFGHTSSTTPLERSTSRGASFLPRACCGNTILGFAENRGCPSGSVVLETRVGLGWCLVVMKNSDEPSK